MGPVTAVSSFFGRALDFYGRSRRLEYIWMLVISILATGLAIALFISVGIDEEALETGQASPLAQVIIWTFIIVQVVTLVPWTALMVRRFHDTGHTGWMVALFMGLWIIPPIGALGAIVQFFWLLFGSGSAGNNQYGADPRFSTTSAFS